MYGDVIIKNMKSIVFTTCCQGGYLHILLNINRCEGYVITTLQQALETVIYLVQYIFMKTIIKSSVYSIV